MPIEYRSSNAVNPFIGFRPVGGVTLGAHPIALPSQLNAISDRTGRAGDKIDLFEHFPAFVGRSESKQDLAGRVVNLSWRRDR